MVAFGLGVSSYQLTLVTLSVTSPMYTEYLRNHGNEKNDGGDDDDDDNEEEEEEDGDDGRVNSNDDGGNSVDNKKKLWWCLNQTYSLAT